jgi:rhodanese-related sulfurtransferase
MRHLFGKPPFEEVDAREYHEQFNGKDHILIDVRTVGEFNSGHAPHAINIPLNELFFRQSEIPTDKPVVFICATGNRSGNAAMIFKQAGRDDVYNLRGGTMGWMRSGFEIAR